MTKKNKGNSENARIIALSPEELADEFGGIAVHTAKKIYAETMVSGWNRAGEYGYFEMLKDSAFLGLYEAHRLFKNKQTGKFSALAFKCCREYAMDCRFEDMGVTPQARREMFRVEKAVNVIWEQTGNFDLAVGVVARDMKRSRSWVRATYEIKTKRVFDMKSSETKIETEDGTDYVDVAEQSSDSFQDYVIHEVGVKGNQGMRTDLINNPKPKYKHISTPADSSGPPLMGPMPYCAPGSHPTNRGSRKKGAEKRKREAEIRERLSDDEFQFFLHCRRRVRAKEFICPDFVTPEYLEKRIADATAMADRLNTLRVAKKKYRWQDFIKLTEEFDAGRLGTMPDDRVDLSEEPKHDLITEYESAVKNFLAGGPGNSKLNSSPLDDVKERTASDDAVVEAKERELLQVQADKMQKVYDARQADKMQKIHDAREEERRELALACSMYHAVLTKTSILKKENQHENY